MYAVLCGQKSYYSSSDSSTNLNLVLLEGDKSSVSRTFKEQNCIFSSVFSEAVRLLLGLFCG